MPERLFIIDGHSHCYQAYYAISGLTSPAGTPVNAVYGFIGMLRKLIREQNPEYLAVAFDSKGPTFRHESYAEYKANRKETPDDLEVQFPLIFRVLEAYGIPVYSCEGYEGDDVIGTLAKQASKKHVETHIVTADKDMEQLIDPYVKIYNAKKDRTQDLETLKKEKGITPEQVKDVLALMGDSVDNIPGVPGIGPKTAVELVQKWGSLEGVLEHLDSLNGTKRMEKIRDSLRSSAQQAHTAKELVTISLDAPVELDLEASRRDRGNDDELRKIFEELGFNSLLAQMAPATEAKKTDYHIVNTPERFRDFLKELSGQDVFSFDLETTSLNVVEAGIVGLSFSWNEDEAYYVPLLAPEGAVTLPQDVLDDLKPILENPGIKKIGQNLKYDCTVLKNYDIELRGIAFDTMIASYLINPGRRRHGLDELAMQYLSYQTTPITELIGQGRGKEQLTMDKVELEKVARYACEDADVACCLAHRMRPLLERDGLLKLFEEVEVPLVSVLADMEYAGIKVDTELLEEMSGHLKEKLSTLEEDIFHLAGERFNVDSPKQVAGILFEKLGLKPLARTKTGPSTVARVLETLSKQHPLPALLMERRQLSKLKSTYVDALPRLISARTGRVHTSFNQTATATGRLSSSEPNLQNIPVRSDLGRQIRRAFIPSRDGLIFMSMDYSQIELRILAHFSEDPALMDAFKNERDIHASVASDIYGVGLDDVTPEMRGTAKAVNFGIVYGLSPMGLSREVGITLKEAGAFIESYFKLFEGVKRFRDRVIEETRETGYVTTILGRRRPVTEISAQNKHKRSLAERIAVNTIVQGSAADLIKVAMNKTCARLKETGLNAKMLLQIHDELLFELPEKELDATRKAVEEEMTQALTLRVSIRVNVKTGKNWLEAE
ncbi:MAG: DNA polymerase I [Candidatus Brocadiales bacterium]|nr:DNA polymerase I [Candidatus Bathyanammoxibius amoris]